MNLNKHLDFFNPEGLIVHVIGVGAIGSTVCEMLTRLGVTTIVAHDFDTVEDVNIANQMYEFQDIGKLKVDAIQRICTSINPDVEFCVNPKGWTPTNRLSGVVVLAVDSINTRKQILESLQNSTHVEAVLDFRMRLEDAQHYAANWADKQSRERLLSTMQFTDEEAKEATPVSACGTTLAIAPTIRTVVSMGIANLINFKKTGKLVETVMVNPFTQFTAAL